MLCRPPFSATSIRHSRTVLSWWHIATNPLGEGKTQGHSRQGQAGGSVSRISQRGGQYSWENHEGCICVVCSSVPRPFLALLGILHKESLNILIHFYNDKNSSGVLTKAILFFECLCPRSVKATQASVGLGGGPWEALPFSESMELGYSCPRGHPHHPQRDGTCVLAEPLCF